VCIEICLLVLINKKDFDIFVERVIKGSKPMGRSRRSIEKSGDNTLCGSTAAFIHSLNACGWARNFIDKQTYLFAGS
jgi:hypothetical protein